MNWMNFIVIRAHESPLNNKLQHIISLDIEGQNLFSCNKRFFIFKKTSEKETQQVITFLKHVYQQAIHRVGLSIIRVIGEKRFYFPYSVLTGLHCVLILLAAHSCIKVDIYLKNDYKQMNYKYQFSFSAFQRTAYLNRCLLLQHYTVSFTNSYQHYSESKSTLVIEKRKRIKLIPGQK